MAPGLGLGGENDKKKIYNKSQIKSADSLAEKWRK